VVGHEEGSTPQLITSRRKVLEQNGEMLWDQIARLTPKARTIQRQDTNPNTSKLMLEKQPNTGATSLKKAEVVPAVAHRRTERFQPPYTLMAQVTAKSGEARITLVMESGTSH
jgi:hypothetical protein